MNSKNLIRMNEIAKQLAECSRELSQLLSQENAEASKRMRARVKKVIQAKKKEVEI